jgi:hypothetical protein
VTVAAPAISLDFPHAWHAQILHARPLILPPRHFTYPRDAEEIERGALEIMIRPPAEGSPSSAQDFLATCALGFRDPAVPTGIWSAPNPLEICAVSGGYAYLIDTAAPERFSMIAYRPVLEVRALTTQNMLLFIGHRSIVEWGSSGQAWETPKLSDEGLTIAAIDGATLLGLGWNMLTDCETPFTVDLATGACKF